MQALATTRMSSKGQVVIPEEVRNRLHLEAGTQFVVVGEDDVVILKSIQRPSMTEFDDLIGKARQQARATGMKRSDITAAVARARGRK
jgi:AbrB family looped-hinge helix DNA binding protein